MATKLLTLKGPGDDLALVEVGSPAHQHFVKRGYRPKSDAGASDTAPVRPDAADESVDTKKASKPSGATSARPPNTTPRRRSRR